MIKKLHFIQFIIFLLSIIANALFILGISPELVFRIPSVLVFISLTAINFYNMRRYSKLSQDEKNALMQKEKDNNNKIFTTIYSILGVLWIISFAIALFSN